MRELCLLPIFQEGKISVKWIEAIPWETGIQILNPLLQGKVARIIQWERRTTIRAAAAFGFLAQPWSQHFIIVQKTSAVIPCNLFFFCFWLFSCGMHVLVRPFWSAFLLLFLCLEFVITNWHQGQRVQTKELQPLFYLCVPMVLDFIICPPWKMWSNLRPPEKCASLC